MPKPCKYKVDDDERIMVYSGDVLLRVGTKRFGAPDAATIAALEATTSIAVLVRLTDRLLEVEKWAELLA